MIQSCFVFTLFIILAFLGASSFMSSIISAQNSRHSRTLFLMGLFGMYVATIFISVQLSASPLSYDFIPSCMVAFLTFWGIVGVTFAILEFVPELVKMLNNSISFSLMTSYYKLFGGNYIGQLNTLFQQLFEYKPNTSNITPAEDFPYYLLMHYFTWNTWEQDTASDSKAMQKISEFGIQLKDGADLSKMADKLFELFWMSYFIVLNFAMNSALIIAFIVMLLEPKVT